MKIFTNWIESARRFLEDGGFAAFAFLLLLGFDALMLGLLLIPGGDEGIGAFANELRVWCFGLDPNTGKLKWSYIFSMLSPPLMLSATLLIFWGMPMRRIFSRPRSFALHLLPALILLIGAGASFAFLSGPAQQDQFSFPAEEIRTGLPAPELSLVNQAGEEVDLAELRGKVLVLTSIYTCCPHTCPTILLQAKAAIEALPPHLLPDLRFVAVTMDPAFDTTEVLGKFATAQNLSLPLYNLVTGEVAEVENTLDSMGISRERDQMTKVIAHNNQYLLIDKKGKLAYRLGLGDRQQRWLSAAMEILLLEDKDGGRDAD